MCTGIRFTDDSGNLYFGRNLDWDSDFGQSVYVTQRGFSHPKFQDGKITSKHAAVGAAICVDGFPLYFDVGNEVGLACGGLNFPGYAKYADGNNVPAGKTAVPSYEFPLWVVSQFQTVDEVKAALEDIAITDTPFSEQFQASLLHWLIGDGEKSIVVEYMEDGMHVYDNDLDVLANQPTFPYHHENVRSYLNVSPEYPGKVVWERDDIKPYGGGSLMRGLPGDFYSPSRFVRVAYFNAHYPVQQGEQANVTRLFKTLHGVMQIEGASKMESGHFEISTYTGGYSQATKSYYYSKYDDFKIHKYPIEEIGFDGGKAVAAKEVAF